MVDERSDADADDPTMPMADDEPERADPDAGSVDDVVVDLFARLRATNDTAEPDVDGDGPDDRADELTPTTTRRRASDDDATIDATRRCRHREMPSTTVRASTSVEATPFDQRDADLTPLIVASARKLKRVLADEQNEVLDALRRSDPVRDLDALLPWTSHHAERYSSVLGDELHAAANAGAALTAADGRTPKLRKAAARQAVQQGSETLTRVAGRTAA